MKLLSAGLAIVAALALLPPGAASQQKPAASGPIIVLDTAKGVIEFETYPEEAPKTVAHFIALVKKNFYNGQRFHRVVPNFVAQIGDPQSRNMTLEQSWGRRGSGNKIGIVEFSKKRTHARGAVAMAHAGSALDADSQFYITLRSTPELDGKHVVFGRVIRGLEVANNLRKADLLRKASVRE